MDQKLRSDLINSEGLTYKQREFDIDAIESSNDSSDSRSQNFHQSVRASKQLELAESNPNSCQAPQEFGTSKRDQMERDNRMQQQQQQHAEADNDNNNIDENVDDDEDERHQNTEIVDDRHTQQRAGYGQSDCRSPISASASDSASSSSSLSPSLFVEQSEAHQSKQLDLRASNRIEQLTLQQQFIMNQSMGKHELAANRKEAQHSQQQQNLDDGVKQVELFGVQIVALTINGRQRLCLAQISNTLLKGFSYNEIHNRRVALGITCVQCTPIQLEMLRRAGAMPSSSRRCGMITMREAERLCRSFLVEEQPPELPDNFYFNVAHRINYGCRGRFVPARYISSRAKCIECFYCGDFFSPNKFIFHSHRQPHATECNPPDSPNINSWRKHIDLDWTIEHSQETRYAWEDVKSLFNGGTRKRMPMGPNPSLLHQASNEARKSSETNQANHSNMNRVSRRQLVSHSNTGSDPKVRPTEVIDEQVIDVDGDGDADNDANANANVDGHGHGDRDEDEDEDRDIDRDRDRDGHRDVEAERGQPKGTQPKQLGATNKSTQDVRNYSSTTSANDTFWPQTSYSNPRYCVPISGIRHSASSLMAVQQQMSQVSQIKKSPSPLKRAIQSQAELRSSQNPLKRYAIEADIPHNPSMQSQRHHPIKFEQTQLDQTDHFQDLSPDLLPTPASRSLACLNTQGPHAIEDSSKISRSRMQPIQLGFGHGGDLTSQAQAQAQAQIQTQSSSSPSSFAFDLMNSSPNSSVASSSKQHRQPTSIIAAPAGGQQESQCLSMPSSYIPSTAFLYNQLCAQLTQRNQLQSPGNLVANHQQLGLDAQTALRHQFWSSLLANLQAGQGSQPSDTSVSNGQRYSSMSSNETSNPLATIQGEAPNELSMIQSQGHPNLSHIIAAQFCSLPTPFGRTNKLAPS